MKRHYVCIIKLYLCLFLTALFYPLALCESPFFDERKASEYALGIVSRSLMLSSADMETLEQSIYRDNDCWVYEVRINGLNHIECVLIFDNSGYIHSFHDLSCDIPDSFDLDYEMPLSSDDNQFLHDANLLTIRWLTETRGWSYEYFSLIQKTDENTMLFSINGFAEYIVISREKNGSMRIRSYGSFRYSHGRFKNGITQEDAIEIARKEYDGYDIVFIGFSVDSGLAKEKGTDFIPNWILLLCSNASDEMPDTISIVRIDPVSGEVIQEELLGNGRYFRMN